MRAAFYDRIGPARDVLEVAELPDPVSGPGDVLVRLHASGVNPSDVKGRGRPRATESPRIVPHSDGSGVVEAVGPGVPAARVGERVYLYNACWERTRGTAAERVALPATQAVPLPEGMGFAEGACLGIPAMTAHRCVFADGPVAGRWVLVTGGAGAVGHYAVQFAKWGGARVIATASGDEKAAHARAAGADHVVNYRSDDVANRVMELTGGQGVDRIVEVAFGANLGVTQQVIRNNGTVAVYASDAVRDPVVPIYPLLYRNVTVRTVLVYNMPDEARSAAIRDIAAAQAGGALKHAVGAEVLLSDIAAAHEMVERGEVIGNVVVTIS